MKVSLIVVTYNWKEALSLVLISTLRQTLLPHELIVADDGSGEDTRELIQRHARRAPFPVRHVWQQDAGFRAGRARNRGVAAAEGEYIIFIDGDMVLNAHFVADHTRFATPDTFVQGSRVLTGPGLTERMLRDEIIDIGFFTPGIQRRRHTVRSRFLSYLLSRKTASTRFIKSCNQGFWRDDLVRVNGFNEDIHGWGREDNELAVRVLNSGVKRRTLKFQGLAYHLYHEGVSSSRLAANDAILEETVAANRVRCKNGLDQHLRA